MCGICKWLAFFVLTVLSESAFGFAVDAGFQSAQIPNSQGCPLASIWTVGSSYPFNNVEGPLNGVTGVFFSEPSSCTKTEFKAIADKIQQDYADGIVDGPGSNRLLFHSTATFSAAGGAGGLGGVNGGWLQFPQNLEFPANNGLADTVTYIKDLVKNYSCITFADAATLNGAIVTEAAGGPAIAWMPGRRDASKTPENPVITTRLPDGSYNTAGVVSFYTQMGLTDREMAVFNGGGHSLGGCHPENSGWNGSFTPASDRFPSPKNLYFIQTFEGEWTPMAVRNSTQLRIQYALVDPEGSPVTDADGNRIIRLPSDTSILLGGNYPTAWAYSYSKDEDLFMADYGRVLQRVSQLGAGASGWSLNQSQYEWLGINGTAINYGVDIEPQGGDPPIPVDQVEPPLWIQKLMQAPTTLMATAQLSVPSTTESNAIPFSFSLAAFLISFQLFHSSFL